MPEWLVAAITTAALIVLALWARDRRLRREVNRHFLATPWIELPFDYKPDEDEPAESAPSP